MASQEDVIEQQKLLQIYRQTLSHYLQQRAMLGLAYIPPGVTHGILETRENIRHTKEILRNWGTEIEDHPNDEEPITASQKQYIIPDSGITHAHQADNSSPPASTSVEAGDTESKYKALIIEDAKLHQMAIISVLDQFGINHIVANDIDQALVCIRSGEFSIVTLDMQLELLDNQGQAGVLLLDQLRTYQPNASIIIISGLEWTGPDVRNFFVKYRAVDFLKKPFDPDDLKCRIKAILDNETED